MSRLYGASVDKSRWDIIEIDSSNYHSYNLIDKETMSSYYLNNIIGIEQVGEEEFLIYDRYNEDSFRIVRYRAEKAGLVKMFETKFSFFQFITEDRILFTYWSNSGGYYCSGIYSVKDNKYLEEGKWLDRKLVETHVSADDPEKIELYVNETLFSSMLGNPKLVYSVNSETLEPTSLCYSQLRDSYIEVTSKSDLDTIRYEDSKYISIIEKIMFQEEREQLQKAKEKILSKHSENK